MNCLNKINKPAKGLEKEAVIKLNLDPSKLATQFMYKMKFAEIRKNLVSCGCCSQPAHFYIQLFPWGKDIYGSTRGFTKI